MTNSLCLPSIGPVVVLCMAFAEPGIADTLTETFTFPTLAGFSSEPGSDLTLFNPALGTLNSIKRNCFRFTTGILTKRRWRQSCTALKAPKGRPLRVNSRIRFG